MEKPSHSFPGHPVEVGIDLDVCSGPAAGPWFPRWLTVGGATVFVAALGALAFIVRDRGDIDPRHIRAGADASAVLNAAADAAERSPDDTPSGGQARLNAIRRFTLDVSPTADGGNETVRNDLLVEEWIPADLREPWLSRTREPEPAAMWDLRWGPPAVTRGTVVNEHSGRCGVYFPAPDEDPCTRAGLWQDPTPVFLAGLPSEPRELLARLRADVEPEAAEPDQEVLLYAAAALERWLPRDVRAGLYRALALIPGLRVPQDTVVLEDGRTGVAVGLESHGVEVQLALEADDGAFLGWRRMVTTSQDGLEAGTVVAMTIVRTAVVSAVGWRPAIPNR
jgi:hypothetical protein